MENILKTWLAIFMTLLMLFTGVGIISANIDSKNAKRFVDICQVAVSESVFHPEVMDTCRQMAEDNGYHMVITEKDTNHDGFTDTAYLFLEYAYEIPFIGLTGITKTIKTTLK